MLPTIPYTPKMAQEGSFWNIRAPLSEGRGIGRWAKEPA